MKKVKGFLHSAAVFVVMSLLLICGGGVLYWK